MLLGDPPLFPQYEKVELGWKILDPVLDYWASLPTQPEPYAAGTWGSASAVEMLARDFIYFRPFFEGNQYFTENSHDPMTLPLKNMPVIDGYMLVEGHPIHKDTTPKELSEILKPIYGEHFVNLMGTVCPTARPWPRHT